MRAVNLAHAAGTERSNYAVGSDMTTHRRSCRGEGGVLNSRRLQEAARLCVFGEKKLYLAAEFAVALTSTLEKRRARSGGKIRGSVKQLLGFAPQFRIHGPSPSCCV